MTPEFLARVGATLYGEHWQPEIARVLNVSVRTVRKWKTGERVMNAGMLTELAAVCERNSVELVDVAKLLREAARMAPPAEGNPAARKPTTHWEE